MSQKYKLNSFTGLKPSEKISFLNTYKNILQNSKIFYALRRMYLTKNKDIEKSIIEYISENALNFRNDLNTKKIIKNKKSQGTKLLNLFIDQIIIRINNNRGYEKYSAFFGRFSDTIKDVKTKNTIKDFTNNIGNFGDNVNDNTLVNALNAIENVQIISKPNSVNVEEKTGEQEEKTGEQEEKTGEQEEKTGEEKTGEQEEKTGEEKTGEQNLEEQGENTGEQDPEELDTGELDTGEQGASRTAKLLKYATIKNFKILLLLVIAIAIVLIFILLLKNPVCTESRFTKNKTTIDAVLMRSLRAKFIVA